MKIAYGVDRHLTDRFPVYQTASREQYLVNVDRVVRADPRVTFRQAGAEGVGIYVDRPDLLWPRMARAIDPPAPHPDHRPGFAGCGGHHHIGLDRLDRYVALRRADQRPRCEARHGQPPASWT